MSNKKNKKTDPLDIELKKIKRIFLCLFSFISVIFFIELLSVILKNSEKVFNISFLFTNYIVVSISFISFCFFVQSIVGEVCKKAKENGKKVYFDLLTDLYNETKLIEDIKVMNYKSIAYMDIDNFKKINDTYLHDTGDKVLIKLAEVFSGKYSILYRLHGDEFTILSYLSKEDLKNYLELKMITYTQSCIECFGFSSTVSIGITDFVQELGTENLDNADILLYESKHQGKNKIIVG